MAWAPDYVTRGELADELRIDDTLDDAQLDRAITAASRSVDRHCKRQFGLVDAPEARQYTPTWSRSRCAWMAPIDDLMTITGLEVAVEQYSAGVFVAVTAPILRPLNAVPNGQPWTEVVIPADSAVGPLFGREGSVRVTARFGWTTVPIAVKQATLLQASRLVARRDAPFGIAGSPDAGSEMRLLARVDPDVAVTLGGYRKRVWAR